MKRYQNPDVFELLAMHYALGTLHGKARLRFEHLMEKHLYLRATTQAYQQQFNGLNGLLPPLAPPARVWQRLEQELGLQVKKATPGWLERIKTTLYWSAPVLASLVAAFLTVLYLNSSPLPSAYVATLRSVVQKDQVVVAMADKDDMMLRFEMLDKALPRQDDRVPTLWCISKNKDEAPLRMGTLTASNDHQLALNQQQWRGLQDVSAFVVSMEPPNAADQAQPQGEIVLSGELRQLGKE